MAQVIFCKVLRQEGKRSAVTREEKIAAMQQHSKEFNGKFYVAVKTTGIVCLPSCSARPLPKNVEFYDNYEDAISDGYRNPPVARILMFAADENI